MARDSRLDGMRNPENGDLGAPVPSGSILVPGLISYDEASESLRWQLGSHTKWVKPDTKFLEEFLTLGKRETQPSSIVDYAKRWGVLALRDRILCAEGRSEGVEPLAAWKFLSRRAHSVLNIAVSLANGQIGSAGDWSQISFITDNEAEFQKVVQAPVEGLPCVADAFKIISSENKREKRLKLARDALAGELNNWLCLGRHNRTRSWSDFYVDWNPISGQWELSINFSGFLVSAIALQIVLTVAGVASLYTCTGCGTPYIRRKKAPRADQANFCSDCGPEAALRQADQRRREKMIEARRLSALGFSSAVIAQKLDTKIDSVCRWITKGTDNGKKTRAR